MLDWRHTRAQAHEGTREPEPSIAALPDRDRRSRRRLGGRSAGAGAVVVLVWRDHQPARQGARHADGRPRRRQPRSCRARDALLRAPLSDKTEPLALQLERAIPPLSFLMRRAGG
jgi:hypothetical protein